jgi:hypothetical protein
MNCTKLPLIRVTWPLGQQAAYITSDEHCCIAPRIRTIPNCQVAQAAPMWMEMDAGQQKIDKSPLENQ